MPIVLLIIGAVLLITAVRNTHKELGELLKTQFTGPGSFTAWALAFIMLALIGTIDPLRPISRGLMALLLIVMILVNSREVNLLTLLQAQLFGRALGSSVASSIPR